MRDLGFRVWGVWGLGFGVWGVMFRVGGFRVYGVGSSQGLGFGVWCGLFCCRLSLFHGPDSMT